MTLYGLFAALHIEACNPRTLPVVLPHELFPWLVQRGLFDLSDSTEIVRFWTHARSAGLPTGGATDFHIPLWIWGDDAKFTETHQDKLVVVAFGRLLETSKNALKTVWPLFTYQQVGETSNPLDVSQPQTHTIPNHCNPHTN